MSSMQIHALGFYQTRGGQVVEITKIYQSQPVAEGTMDGKSYLWNVDGTTNKWKQTDRDIVKYLGLAYDHY
jgi:hypothetical protein